MSAVSDYIFEHKYVIFSFCLHQIVETDSFCIKGHILDCVRPVTLRLCPNRLRSSAGQIILLERYCDFDHVLCHAETSVLIFVFRIFWCIACALSFVAILARDIGIVQTVVSILCLRLSVIDVHFVVSTWTHLIVTENALAISAVGRFILLYRLRFCLVTELLASTRAASFSFLGGHSALAAGATLITVGVLTVGIVVALLLATCPAGWITPARRSWRNLGMR